MAEYDFSALFAQYPGIIVHMKDTFTSHKFILELASQNQTEYVEALYHYRHSVHMENPAPFKFVHQVLANHLRNYPGLLEQTLPDVKSNDIFGHKNKCSKWRKI